MKPGVHRAVVLWGIEDAVRRLDDIAQRAQRLNEIVTRETPAPVEPCSDAWWAEQAEGMRTVMRSPAYREAEAQIALKRARRLQSTYRKNLNPGGEDG